MEPTESGERSSRVVSSLRVRDGGARAVVPIPGHEAAAAARVELVREGDVVRAIDVVCSCGQRLRVLCEYEGEAGG